MSNAARQFGGTATYPPANLVELDTKRMLSFDRAEAADEAAEVAAAADAVEAQSRAEIEARIAAAADPFETMDPPEASDLGITVDGLPAKRALLVRFVAWIAHLQDTLRNLESGRAAFLASIGAPVLTESELEALVSADKTKFLGWLRSGGSAITRPQIRSFEREQIEAKLPVQKHEREVAVAALRECEIEIDTITRQIDILEKRRETFVKMAMIEHAVADGAEYMAAIHVLEDKLARLLGLASIAGAVGDLWETGNQRFYKNYSSDPSFQVALPRFGLSSVPDSFDAIDRKWTGDGRPEVNVSAERIEKAAKPWKDLLERWCVDPRAEPGRCAR